MKKKTLEELKKLAVSAPLTPALSEDTNFDKVNKFISVFNIEQGKHKITASLLYKVYKDWSPNPIRRIAFHKEFGKLFPSEFINKRTVYKLNYKPGALVKKGQQLVDLRNSIE